MNPAVRSEALTRLDTMTNLLEQLAEGNRKMLDVLAHGVCGTCGEPRNRPHRLGCEAQG